MSAPPTVASPTSCCSAERPAWWPSTSATGNWLRQILPAVVTVLRDGADVVALVKPQFEAGRDEVRKGIIRDPAVHDRVLAEVTAAGAEVGLTRVGSTPSPITGQKGNVEFLLHLRP